MPKDPPAPMCDEQIPSYVQPYGYAALGPATWQKCSATTLWPKLTLTILSHSEIEDHTFYQVKCALATARSLSLTWTVHRRLVHLREGLHDFVQNLLGTTYDTVFGEARFARRGGLPGTTARLQAWLETLAAHVNGGTASPATVAQILNFFDTPKPPVGATARALLDFVDVPKPHAKSTAETSAAEPTSPSAPCSRKPSRPAPAGLSPLAALPCAQKKVSFREFRESEQADVALDSTCKDHAEFACADHLQLQIVQSGYLALQK